MKKITGFPHFLILALLSILLQACDTGGFFLSDNLSRDLAVETVSSGSVLSSDAEIPIIIDERLLSGTPDLVIVSIVDEAGESVSETLYEGLDLSFPELEPVVLSATEEGVYQLEVFLYEGDEEIGTLESWFFVTDRDLKPSVITVNPHSAEPGESVLITVEFDAEDAGNYWLQFRMDGDVLYEGLESGQTGGIEFTAPELPGVYDLQIDVYPGYDSRIDEDIRSNRSSSLELLVTGAKSEEQNQSGIETFDVSTSAEYSEGLLFAQNQELQYSELSFSPALVSEALRFTGEDVALFSAGTEDFTLYSSFSGQSLNLDLNTVSGSYRVSAVVNPTGEDLNVQLLKGSNRVTVLLSQGGRTLGGEVIPFSRFTTEEAKAEFVGIAPGVISYGAAKGELEIRYTPEDASLTSLFKQILEQRYGNFILYAEGFEFQSAVHNSISYSDQAYLEDGYLVLPAGAWLELPAFALDEYRIDFEIVYTNASQASTVSLLQLNGNEADEVFTIAAMNSLSASGAVLMSDLSTNGKLTFSVGTSENSLQVFSGEDSATLPVTQTGKYRLYIRQGAAASLRLKIDSVSAVNAPSDLVDMVLQNLP